MATILDNPRFKPEKSCASLRKAIEEKSEPELIKILTKHSNAQRQVIVAKYKEIFQRDLVADLKSKLRGDFKSVILALLDPVPLFLAKELKRAIKGIGTDEKALIEIICSRPNKDLKVIKKEYKREFGVPLKKDVQGDTSGHLQNFLVSFLRAKRIEETEEDCIMADADATILKEVGINRVGVDQAVFIQIFCTRGPKQLKATFEKYKEKTGQGILETIRNEMKGDLQSGFKAIAKSAMDTESYYAERLYKSMKGLGTDDQTLIRIIVSRAEIDLKSISKSFHDKYGYDLSHFIKDDSSGDYRKCLLAILGNN